MVVPYNKIEMPFKTQNKKGQRYTLTGEFKDGLLEGTITNKNEIQTVAIYFFVGNLPGVFFCFLFRNRHKWCPPVATK